MSRRSCFGYSSVSSFDSCPQEKESISNQLDRINSVLQSFAFETYSPDLSKHIYSPSLDSFNEFSKTSMDDCDENQLHENLYRGIEETLLELDRSLMINEDFRSMEIDKFEKRQKFEKVDAEISVETSIEGVVEFVNELKMIIATSNSEKIARDVRIGNKTIKFKISHGIDLIRDKDEIMELVSSATRRAVESYSPSLKQNDFIYNLEESMEKSYNEDICKAPESFRNRGSFVSSAEITQFSSQLSYQRRLIECLEWQCYETNLIKVKYENKLQSLADKMKGPIDVGIETKLSEKTSEKLIVLNEITNQGLKLKKESPKKELQCDGILSGIMNVSKILTNPDIKSVNYHGLEKDRKYLCSDQNIEVDTQMKILQNEILKLEYKLKTEKQNPEPIQLKIDRLKTQQSKLKTARVMKESIERSKCFASRLKLSSRKIIEYPLRNPKKPNSETPFFMYSASTHPV